MPPKKKAEGTKVAPINDDGAEQVDKEKTKKEVKTKQIKEEKPKKESKKPARAAKNGDDVDQQEEEEKVGKATKKVSAKKLKTDGDSENPKQSAKGSKSDKNEEETGETNSNRPLRKRKIITYEAAEDSGDEFVKGKKKPGRKTKSSKTKEVVDDDDDDGGDAAPKKTRKAPAKRAEKEEKSSGTLNPTETLWEEIDFSCDKRNPDGEEYNWKITSWNVDGLRAWVKKGGAQILQHDKPDILCLQETKCSKEQLPDEIANVDGYHGYWTESTKEGYAGVGILTKQMPLEVTFGIAEEEHDEEGRCITAEYPEFYLICVYVPNAGRKLVTLPKRLDWNEVFKKYVLDLNAKKPVIVCGDMNVAHEPIDLANPKTNTKNAGFTAEERAGMTDFLGSGFVDVYRKLYPDKAGAYTFWTYMMKARSKNVGWRLDYFLVPEAIADKVCDCVIQDKVLGSDHCPLSLYIHL